MFLTTKVYVEQRLIVTELHLPSSNYIIIIKLRDSTSSPVPVFY